MLTGLKVSSLTCKCVLYRSELNSKGGPPWIEFWMFWNEIYQKTKKKEEKWKKAESIKK